MTPPELYSPREKFLEIHEAVDAVSESLIWSEAEGRISSEYVYLYPPGIPILVPGELVTDEVIEKIEACKEGDLQIRGTLDVGAELLRVVATDAFMGYNEKM